MRYCAVTVALLGGLVCGLNAFADEAAAVPPAEAPLMVRDARCGQVLVRCTVDGAELRLLLDTGATHTVIDRTAAAEKLAKSQRVDTTGMQFSSSSSAVRPDILLVTVAAGGRTMPQQPVLVLPLDGVRAALATPVDGILGMDVLKRLSFTLDFRADGVSCWGEPAEGDGTPVPLKARPDGGFCPLLAVKLGDKEIFPVLLDSGSSVTVLPEKLWSAGMQGEHSAHVADVNGGRSQGVKVGNAAPVQLAEGVSTVVTPQLSDERMRGDGLLGLIGVDALRGLRLVYTPEKGFFLVK